MDRVEATYQATVVRLTELQLADEALARGRRSVQVRVLDDPALMEDLVWPQPATLLGLSALLGLVSGCLLAPWGERWTRGRDASQRT